MRNDALQFWGLCFALGIASAPFTADGASSQPFPVPKEKMLLFLPDAKEVPGAVSATEVEHYTRENLWVKLNGAAETWISYDCFQMTLRDYRWRAADGKEWFVSARVFDMGTPLLAFGIFGELRFREAKPADIGTAAAVTDTDVTFFLGRFLCNVVWQKGEAQALESGMQLAKAIEERLPPATKELPKELNLLPPHNRLPYTERFVLRNVLGMDFLRNGVGATYRAAKQGQEMTLWICDLSTPKSARKSFGKYSQWLKKKIPLTISGAGKAICGDEPLGGRTFVLLKSRYVAILQGAPTTKAALPVLREVVKRL